MTRVGINYSKLQFQLQHPNSFRINIAIIYVRVVLENPTRITINRSRGISLRHEFVQECVRDKRFLERYCIGVGFRSSSQVMLGQGGLRAFFGSVGLNGFCRWAEVGLKMGFWVQK